MLNVRAVPEIILMQGGGWATFFFRPLHPQDTHGVRAPRPPGHVSALINLPHYGSNTPWSPGQVTSPPPTPRSTKPPPPTGQKSVFNCGSPPEDNFWNSPKAVTYLQKAVQAGITQLQRNIFTKGRAGITSGSYSPSAVLRPSGLHTAGGRNAAWTLPLDVPYTVSFE